MQLYAFSLCHCQCTGETHWSEESADKDIRHVIRRACCFCCPSLPLFLACSCLWPSHISEKVLLSLTTLTCTIRLHVIHGQARMCARVRQHTHTHTHTQRHKHNILILHIMIIGETAYVLINLSVLFLLLLPAPVAAITSYPFNDNSIANEQLPNNSLWVAYLPPPLPAGLLPSTWQIESEG